MKDIKLTTYDAFCQRYMYRMRSKMVIWTGCPGVRIGFAITSEVKGNGEVASRLYGWVSPEDLEFEMEV
jgi:hypothetical protein